LAERGLILSVEKTHITHIQDGFNFLGFNVRKYKQKLLIKPTKANVLAHIKKLKATIRKGQAMKSEILILLLNSQLRGWANYYRGSVASVAFKYVDQKVFDEMWRMLKRRHTNKPKSWLINKYYQITKGNTWTFRAKYRNKSKEQKTAHLLKCSSITIRRHIKIRAEANPYDPDYKDYFIKRNRRLDKIDHTPIQKPSAEL
jgi:RNA-directed DNA polymerase